MYRGSLPVEGLSPPASGSIQGNTMSIMPRDGTSIVAKSIIQRDDTASERNQRWPIWRYAVWGGMCSSWLVVALGQPQRTNTDGISYLDIASACTKGNWGAVINAYWSPAYPVLLSLWLSVLRLSGYWELWAVRVFNCLTLAGCLWSFEYFISALMTYRDLMDVEVS